MDETANDMNQRVNVCTTNSTYFTLCWFEPAFKQIQMNLSHMPRYSNAFYRCYSGIRQDNTLFLTCKDSGIWKLNGKVYIHPITFEK